MATYSVGDRFIARTRRLDAPALADKMIRRSITRVEIEEMLGDNEVIEVYEHEDRVRYVLLGEVEHRLLHLVIAEDDVINATVVLSAYEPDEAYGWDPATGFRTRKEGP